jgi:hypothetical protein
MGANIIQLFILKSFFHSHYKKFFSKVSNYPDLVDWLEGDPGAPSDEDLWGEEKASYSQHPLNPYPFRGHFRLWVMGEYGVQGWC